MKDKPTIPTYLVDLIEDALDAARMEGAQFGFDKQASDEIKEATKLFRDSWLIQPLLTALRAAYGDEDSIRWAKERVAKNYNDRDAKFRAELEASRKKARDAKI